MCKYWKCYQRITDIAGDMRKRSENMRETDYEYDYPEPDELEPEDEYLDYLEDISRSIENCSERLW